MHISVYKKIKEKSAWPRGKNGSVLLEGLIVLTIINIVIILIFSYIRSINESHTNKIHKERATLLLIESFERIRSARDTAVNMNKKIGWENFIKNIEEEIYEEIDENDSDSNEDSTNTFYILKKSEESGDDIVAGQWIIERQGARKEIFESPIAPYADYTTYIQAKFGKNKDKAINKNETIFDITVRWREMGDQDVVDLYSINQQMRLTNHNIYENLY